MREIKFKGKTKEGEWVYGLPFYSHGTGEWKITRSNGWQPTYNNPDEGETTEYIDIDVKTLSQFTGLKDKYETEIYEGDVITSDRYPFFDEGKPNYNASVEWIFSSWQYVLHCINPNKRGVSEGINNVFEGNGSDFEITGNIHDK